MASLKQVSDTVEYGNRKDFKKELLEFVCEVKFTKVDGTKRQIMGTLNPVIIEKYIEHSEKKDRVVNKNVCPIFDLEDMSFKSFRVDSVLRFTTMPHITGVYLALEAKGKDK